MTEGEKKNWGGPDVIGGDNLPSPVGAEVQNIGGPVAPLPPPIPVPASLCLRDKS